MSSIHAKKDSKYPVRHSFIYLVEQMIKERQPTLILTHLLSFHIKSFSMLPMSSCVFQRSSSGSTQ
jgi:hypothetical protein